MNTKGNHLAAIAGLGLLAFTGSAGAASITCGTDRVWTPADTTGCETVDGNVKDDDITAAFGGDWDNE